MGRKRGKRRYAPIIVEVLASALDSCTRSSRQFQDPQPPVQAPAPLPHLTSPSFTELLVAIEHSSSVNPISGVAMNDPVPLSLLGMPNSEPVPASTVCAAEADLDHQRGVFGMLPHSKYFPSNSTVNSPMPQIISAAIVTMLPTHTPSVVGRNSVWTSNSASPFNPTNPKPCTAVTPSLHPRAPLQPTQPSGNASLPNLHNLHNLQAPQAPLQNSAGKASIPNAGKPWSSLFTNKPRNAGDYTSRKFEIECVDGVMIPLIEVIEAGTLLVGFFLDENPSYWEVRSQFRRFWKLNGRITICYDNSMFFFEFSDPDDRQRILEAVPLIIQGKPFIVTQWSPTVDSAREQVLSIPIWVHFKKIPSVLQPMIDIDWLANLIGDLVCFDVATVKRERFVYVKVLIEVDRLLKERENAQSSFTTMQTVINSNGVGNDGSGSSNKTNNENKTESPVADNRNVDGKKKKNWFMNLSRSDKKR